MSERDLSAQSSDDLARLLNVADNSLIEWQDSEVGEIFQHQMSALLSADLGEFNKRIAEQLPRMLADVTPEIMTFRDLFQHPSPPIELLEWTRQFAKQQGSRTDGSFPRDVAGVVYLSAIAAAILHHDQRITKQDDATLTSRFEWALELEWLDSSVSSILRDALERIRN